MGSNETSCPGLAMPAGDRLKTAQGLRILKVSAAFFPARSFGGPVDVMLDTIRHLLARGHIVTVFASNLADANGSTLFRRSEEREVAGARVLYFRSFWSYRHFAITPELFGVCRRELRSYDIVHLYGFRYFQVLVVALLCRVYRVPYVMQTLGTLPQVVRGRWKKRCYDLLFKQVILGGARQIVVKTGREAQDVVEAGYGRKAVLIPNGFDMPDAAANAVPGRFRTKLEAHHETHLVTFLGRVSEIKGLDLLISGFARFRGKDVRLVVIGPDESGYTGKLKKMAQEVGVGSQVVFAGPLYDVEKFDALVDSDVLVLPSYRENFPRAALEAMACGVPLVMTEQCGMAPVVRDGRAGVVVRAEPGAIANSIEYLLTHEEDRRQFGRNGKRLVASEFRWVRRIDALEALYWSCRKQA